MTDLSINVTDSVVPELDVRVLAERLATGLGGQLAKSGDYARVRRHHMPPRYRASEPEYAAESTVDVVHEGFRQVAGVSRSVLFRVTRAVTLTTESLGRPDWHCLYAAIIQAVTATK